MQKEKEDLIRFGNENLIRELLPVLDNLERAVEHARGEKNENEGLLQGVEMTISQFQKALEKFGASTFSAVGEAFDPGRHEAMGQIESDEHPPNTVVQELQKGCLLNERLLRPAMVMVARAPEKKSPPDIEKN
jgi:molecular chaperone GrpE